MNCQVEKLGGVTVLTIAEPTLDANNADELKKAIEPLLKTTSRLILDLSLVKYIDSCGCGAILTALRWLDQIGGELKLCRLTERVTDAFSLIRMNRILDIFATPEDAIQAFARNPNQV